MESLVVGFVSMGLNSEGLGKISHKESDLCLIASVASVCCSHLVASHSCSLESCMDCTQRRLGRGFPRSGLPNA